MTHYLQYKRFFGIHTPPYLPIPLRDSIAKGKSITERTSDCVAIVLKDSGVRCHYFAWSHVHNKIVAHYPQLKALDEAIKQAAVIAGLSPVNNENLQSTNEDPKCATSLFILLANRLITVSKVFEILEENTALSTLFSEERIDLHSFLTTSCKSEVIFDLFTRWDKTGNTIISTPSLFRNVRGLIAKSISGDCIDILLTKKNNNGTCLLHNKDMFQYAEPLLNTLNETQLTNALLTSNGDGNTPLHYKEILQMALPYLRKLSGKNLQFVLLGPQNPTPMRIGTTEDILPQDIVLKTFDISPYEMFAPEALVIIKKMYLTQVKIYGGNPFHLTGDQMMEECQAHINEYSVTLKSIAKKHEYSQPIPAGTPKQALDGYKKLSARYKDNKEAAKSLYSAYATLCINLCNVFGARPAKKIQQMDKRAEWAIPLIEKLGNFLYGQIQTSQGTVESIS